MKHRQRDDIGTLSRQVTSDEPLRSISDNGGVASEPLVVAKGRGGLMHWSLWAMDLVEREWDHARLQLRQLQVAAQRIQANTLVVQCREGKQLLRVLLSTMESFRALVNEYFFASSKQLLGVAPTQSSWESQSLSLVTKIQRQLRVTEALCGQKTPTFEELQAERSHQLEQEESELQQAALDDLLPLIQSLRALEHSRAFHSQLHDDLRSGDLCTKYTTANFAYGSTPFSTWRQVCAAEPLQRVARLLKQPHSKHDALSSVSNNSNNQLDEQSTTRITTPCVVFGSSTGSLVFFTAQLLGLPTAGVEIVPYLHQVAGELAETHGIGHCQFVNCDMLRVQLEDTRIVVLTSLCWDECVYSAVQEQLARQLPPGALVIDYREGMLSGSTPEFALVDQLQGLPVSWHQGAQCINILEKL